MKCYNNNIKIVNFFFFELITDYFFYMMLLYQMCLFLTNLKRIYSLEMF